MRDSSATNSGPVQGAARPATRPSSAARARVQRRWSLVELARETNRRLRRAGASRPA